MDFVCETFYGILKIASFFSAPYSFELNENTRLKVCSSKGRGGGRKEKGSGLSADVSSDEIIITSFSFFFLFFQDTPSLCNSQAKSKF